LNGNAGIIPANGDASTSNAAATKADDGSVILSGGTRAAGSGVEEPALSLSKGPAVAFAQPQPFPTTPPLASSGQPDFSAVPAMFSTLRPFFEQAVYGTQILDYAIDNISSGPVQWWLPEPQDEKERKNLEFLSTVVLHRKGDFILPVTVEIVFEDGTRQREHWDGVDRWTRFTYTRKTKIRSAEIDPDHTALLDKNLFNNSYTNDGNSLPTRKLTNVWLSFAQLLSQLVTWIV
jgi:hypothetical protein